MRAIAVAAAASNLQMRTRIIHVSDLIELQWIGGVA